MFSEKFKNERKRINLTQEQLSKKLGISRSNIANWENGENYPSVDMLFKCSDLFGCSIDYLLDKTNNRNGSSFDNEPVPEYTGELSRELQNNSTLITLFNKSQNKLNNTEKDILKFIMENAIKKNRKQKSDE